MNSGDAVERARAVVGARFRAFAELPGVMLISEARPMISEGAPGRPGDTSIILGQGLDWEEAATLGAACRSRGVATRPDVSGEAGPAGEAEVHKTRACNVLITRPRRTGGTTYEARLLVPSDNELMLDHYSAMHLPAMVLIEAARQMLLAVTEMYYLAPAAGAHRFLISSLRCEFERLVFPLPAVVRYEVVEHAATTAQLRFDAAVAILQDGRACVTFRSTFTVVDLRLAKRQERIAALALLKAHATPAP
jgi:hypothetical protein